MSGLSLAEMRRIGVQRNQEAQGRGAPKKGPLAAFRRALPGADPKANRPASRAPASPVAAAPTAISAPQAPKRTTAPAIISDASADGAANALRTSLSRHQLVGALTAGAGGFAATGGLLGLSAGALLGGLGGRIVGKRAQQLDLPKIRTAALPQKAAPLLYEAAVNLIGKLGQEKPKLALSVADNAAVSVTTISRGKGLVKVTIGIGLLQLLSTQQAAMLIGQRYAEARLAHLQKSGGVTVETAPRLKALAANLEKRPDLLRFQKVETLKSLASIADHGFAQAARSLSEEADRLTTVCCAHADLADALLSNGLISASALETTQSGGHFADWLEGASQRWTEQNRDSALRILSQYQYPSVHTAHAGIPVHLFERISALGAQAPVPNLPATDPAWSSFSEKVCASLSKRLLGRRKSILQADKTPLSAALKLGTSTPAQETIHQTSRTAKRSLFAALKAKLGKGRQHDLDQLHTAHAPLYEADALYREDAGLGIEAYKSLYEANERWALARLRLGEALVEAGYADGVEHLLASAENLPSALPAILETLNGALTMVSPLEEEPLRQAVEKLVPLAGSIARERNEIDLDRLEAPTMDAIDQQLLMRVFEASDGLREVWVFSVTPSSMPHVPHHAILGLAPGITPDALGALSAQIAEHAGIVGTTAVHLESQHPPGPLGKVLAAHQSVWRR